MPTLRLKPADKDVERDAGVPSPSPSFLLRPSVMEGSEYLAWRGQEAQEPRQLHSSSTAGEAESKEHEGPVSEPEIKQLKLKERIRHFTWTWFTLTMATGGIANVLYTVPLRFSGIYAIGCVFFLLNIFFFLFNICMICTRFYLYPSTLKASFLHPTESLFIPAAVISYGIVLVNITQYGVGDKTGYWLQETMVILYWSYCALALVVSCVVYLLLWSTQTYTISQMTPIWIFPAYPLLLVGPHAGSLSDKTHGSRALGIIVGGYILQGIGFMVSLMVYSAFLYRLMTQKLPKESLRPGMFISVGPSGFTIAGLINMGHNLPNALPSNFMGNGQLTGQVSMIMANWAGMWLWGLAFWFFFVSVGAHYSCATRGRMDFAMTWYSFVFPNTALTTATFAVAQALNGNRAIQIVGCVMTCLLIVTWICVFVMMVRAVALKQILWPQKQEDRDEGGWKEAAEEGQKRDHEKPARSGSPRQLDGEPEHETVKSSENALTGETTSTWPSVRTGAMRVACDMCSCRSAPPGGH